MTIHGSLFTEFKTESRGVVGFEVILSAYTSLLSMAATWSVLLVL